MHESSLQDHNVPKFEEYPLVKLELLSKYFRIIHIFVTDQVFSRNQYVADGKKLFLTLIWFIGFILTDCIQLKFAGN